MRALLPLSRVLSPASITDVTYYISANGSVDNDGLTTSTPINTAKLLTLTLNNKTHLRFNKGDTFENFGDFTFSFHAGSIGAFGTGDNPVLMGSEDISGEDWADEGSGLYSLTTSAIKWLFVADSAAKQAQTGWISISSKPAANIIRVSTASLSAYSDSLVGAQLRGIDQTWLMSYAYTITDYNGTTGDITLDRDATELVAGKYISLWGQKQFITANNDWAYQDGTLWYKSASAPSGLNIRACTKDYGFQVTARNITIDSIDLNQYHTAGFYGPLNQTSDITITNLAITNIKQRGILFNGSNNFHGENLTVTKCGLNGIQVVGDNCYVGGDTPAATTVHTIGMDTNYQTIDEIEGITRSGGMGINLRGGNTNLIEHCLVHDTAWNTIHLAGGADSEARYCHVYNYQKRFRDGAGIYAVGAVPDGSANQVHSGVHIHHNIIHDGATNPENSTIIGGEREPEGIYIDNYCFNTVVEYNTVYGNTGAGIRLNFSTCGAVVRFNNCARNEGGAVRISHNGVLLTLNNTVSNNILVATGAAGVCVEVTQTTSTPLTAMDNNTYINPYTDIIGQHGSTEYTLADWKTEWNMDASSTAMVDYITWSSAVNAEIEVKVEPNYTVNAIDFEIPSGYKQTDGTSGGTVSIPAYSGVIYLKETAA